MASSAIGARPAQVSLSALAVLKLFQRARLAIADEVIE
jgi:hypothetical protein